MLHSFTKILVKIPYDGKSYNVVTYILLPLIFPEVPPVIKIRNIDRDFNNIFWLIY